MHRLFDTMPPQWSHRGWTITLNPHGSRPAGTLYLVADPQGNDGGYCASLQAAREAINEEAAPHGRQP